MTETKRVTKKVKKISPRVKSENYLSRAVLRHARVSPRRARMVLEMVRGKQIEPALQILQFSKQKTAELLLKLIKSAVANAKETKGADIDKLWITGGYVDQGRTMKRWMPAAQGRATPIRKRSSHITVLLSERR